MKLCLQEIPILVVVLGITTSMPLTPIADIDLFEEPEVFLTVSEIVQHQTVGKKEVLLDRIFVVNWAGLTVTNKSFVGIFNKDPFLLTPNNLRQLTLFSLEISIPNGRVVSNQSYPRLNLTWDSPQCTGHWVGHFTDAKLLESSCFKIYPTWMKDMKGVIGKRPLHSIMLPGTHNAGSWKALSDPSQDNLVSNYVICQEDSIYTQLLHGIRHLDLRVGYYENTTEKFWINHSFMRVGAFLPVLRDIRKFATETREILVVDFHNFPMGFSNKSIHDMLVTLIQEELGVLMAPKNMSLNAPLDDFWKVNRTLVVSYSDGGAVSRYNNLWPGVFQQWADTKDLQRLETYMKSAYEETGCKGKLWAVMAHLTFDMTDIFTRPSYGIRGFAQETSEKLLGWFRKYKWDTQSMIVATDYYLGNGLIPMSIKANKNNVVCNGYKKVN